METMPEDHWLGRYVEPADQVEEYFRQMARGAKTEMLPMVGIPQGPPIEEFCVKPYVDADGVQVVSGIGRDGKEYPDPVPMTPPIGYQPPSDLMVMLEQLFARGKAVLEAAELETEEEANDFDIEDDPLDPLTPYERVFTPAPAPAVPPTAPAVPPVVPEPQKAVATAEGAVASPPPGTNGGQQ